MVLAEINVDNYVVCGYGESLIHKSKHQEGRNDETIIVVEYC